jgi:hypothetical protein
MSVTAQRGNALFLILIAVVLFAALAYAITQSNRGGGSDINTEKFALEYARLQQYASLAASELMRLELSGCALSDIYGNGSVTSLPGMFSASCAIFQNHGGRLPRCVFPGRGINQWCEQVSGVSLPGIGTNAGDVFLLIELANTPGTNVQNDAFCTYINEKNGNTDPDMDLVAGLTGDYSPLPGGYGDMTVTAMPTGFTGKMEGCGFTTDPGDKTYLYYSVLEPR